MGHVETQGDDFGGFVDVVFVGVGKNESRTNVDLNVDNDTTAMDLAAVWSPGAERMTGIEVYGGLRYVSNDFSLVVDPIPPSPPESRIGSDASYYDLLLGARYSAPLVGALAAYLQRRHFRRRHRGNFQHRRIRRLPDGPAPLLRWLQTLRNGPGIGQRSGPDGDHVRPGHRLRLQFLIGGSRLAASN